MEYQEIIMTGKFIPEHLTTAEMNAALDADNIGRIIYNTDNETIWFQGPSEWYETVSHPTLGGSNITKYCRIDDANDFEVNQLPYADNTVDLGSSSKRWQVVYATDFIGEASTATYADLAEKYTTKENYPFGTIVEVTEDSDSETGLACLNSEYVAGVISKNPAFRMNSDAEGSYIGLAGRLPIRCIGPIESGDNIVPAGEGVGQSGSKLYRVAIALESNPSPGEKLVECILKV